MSGNSNSENEAQSSNAENEKLSPEELFSEILKSPEEYTTEKVESILLNRSKILSLLKTHRPIKVGDYQYGMSENLLQNRRLIVFEWSDRRMIREYVQRSDRRNLWECKDCNRQYNHQMLATRFFLYLIYGIVFVQKNHKCQPRDYSLVMQYQKFLEEGNAQLARRMVQKVNFTFGENSLSNFINLVENTSMTLSEYLLSAKTGRKTTDNKIVAKNSANLKRKLKDHGVCDSSAESKTSNFEKAMCKKIIASDKPVASNIQKSSESTVQKNETLPIPKANTFPFKIPSTFALKEICAKLGIKYCKEANEFWKEIKFTRIDPSSTNIQTQKFKTKNLYKILSNFFTGKFSDYEQIYFLINSEFRDKLVLDGKLLVDEINELISSYTVTKKHLKFFAEFIPCRIMIFNRDNNDEVKKYGNWKNMGSNILTLVLSFSNRKYSVVLNL